MTLFLLHVLLPHVVDFGGEGSLCGYKVFAQTSKINLMANFYVLELAKLYRKYKMFFRILHRIVQYFEGKNHISLLVRL